MSSNNYVILGGTAVIAAGPTPQNVINDDPVAGETLVANGDGTAEWGVESGGTPGGAAGGDLGGTYPNPTVVSVADVTTGTLPRANQQAQNLTLTGDVTSSGGTTAGATTVAVAINGTSVPATPSAAQLLVAQNGTSSLWKTLTGDSTLTAAGIMTNVAINGTSVPAAPSANQLIVATNGTTASWTSTLPGNYSFTGTPTFSNTLALNTTGSAASLSISGQTGLLTFTGLASTNRAKTVRDAADTILELGGSYTPTGTWTSMTLAGGALSGTFTGAPTLSGNVAFTGTPTFSNALALGSSTATTQSALDNSTKLATTAYSDRYYTQLIVPISDDFLYCNTNNAVTTAVTVSTDTNWQVQQISGGTQAISPQAATDPNLGIVKMTTSATSGQGISLGKSVTCLGALGSNANWEARYTVQLGQTATCCLRIGFTSNYTGDAPSNWMGVEYDTANTGNTDTKFTWVCRTGGSPTYSTTNAVNADTNFHTFKIRSTSAGTILFSVDGGTETSLATNVPTVGLGPFMQIITRTSGASNAVIDRFVFQKSVSR